MAGKIFVGACLQAMVDVNRLQAGSYKEEQLLAA
jgi:hypothetical protein